MVIVPVVALGSELGQLINFIPGTFDLTDLVIYIFFICLSILSVKIILRKQINNWRVSNEN
jgi:hypothetical protein